MNTLPTPSITLRLNALAAAAVVTLAMLAGIDQMASDRGAAAHMVQAAATVPA